MKHSLLSSALLATLALGCSGGTTSPRTSEDGSVEVDSAADQNFAIVDNDEGVLPSFDRKVEVFGVRIFASPEIDSERLLHAANVLAQYVDNDEDGEPDNQAVVDEMVAQNAFLVMWKRESDLDSIEPPQGWAGQDLGNDETIPGYVEGGLSGRFDASLEEVLHLITRVGYASVYPDVFGEEPGTDIAQAMDVARGGQFASVPDPYPEDAWYTYDDTTCTYECMVAEYHYWALTSYLGAQEARLEEIDNEWTLNTRKKLEESDPAVVELLTDPEYRFPTVLPDGKYRR